MAAKQGITIKRVHKNKKAKYTVKKVTAQKISTKNGKTKKYTYTSRKIVNKNGKRKYTYKYR